MNSGPLPCQGSDLPTDLHALIGAKPANHTHIISIVKLQTPLPFGLSMEPDEVLASLLDDLPTAVFSPWVAERVSLTWLREIDDRLGMTRFEEGAAELVRRRRLRLDPGPITIGLHPGLKEEPALMRHTLAHELLHAIGLLEHNEEHEHWVEKMAPLPKLSDSVLLQQIQQRYLGQSSQKEWTCGHCAFTWPRKTLRKPTRCPKCAKVL